MEIIKNLRYDKGETKGGLKALLIGFLLIGLFAWLLLSFVANVGTSYEQFGTLNISDVKVESGGVLDIEDYETYLTDSESRIDAGEESFKDYSSQPESQSILGNFLSFFGTGIIGSFFKLVVNLWQIIITPFTLISSIFALFGVPTIVTNTLQSILVIVIIMAIWRIATGKE